VYLHSFLNWALLGGEWAVHAYGAILLEMELSVPIGGWVAFGAI